MRLQGAARCGIAHRCPWSAGLTLLVCPSAVALLASLGVLALGPLDPLAHRFLRAAPLKSKKLKKQLRDMRFFDVT